MSVYLYKTFQWIGTTASHETKLAVRRIARGHRFKYLHHLFQKALSFLSPKKITPPLPKSKLTDFNLLDHEVAGLFPKISPVSGTSELKKTPQEVTLNCSLEMLHYFSGTNKKSWLKNPEDVFSFLGSFLQGKFPNPLSLSMQEKVFAGLQRQQQFQESIHELAEVNITEEIRQQNLKNMAVDLQQQVANLDKDASWFYFGELPSQSIKTSLFADGHLKKNLSPSIYNLIQNSQGDSSAFLRKEIIRQLLEKGLIDPSSKKTKVEILLEKTLKQIEEKTCRLLPKSWYEKIVGSLKEDLKDLILDPKKKHEVSDRLWKGMTEQGLVKTVESVIKETFSSCKEMVQENLESVKSEFSNMPKIMLQGLATAGINLTPLEKFSFELKKQKNATGNEKAKYRLTFFSNDLKGDLHPHIKGEKEGLHLPLVFNNIDLDKLDTTFFSLLLCYEALPHWEKEVSYSLEDLHNSLVHLLEVEPEKPSENTIYPDSMPPHGDLVDWLKIYIHHASCDDKKIDFHQLYHFDLPYQLLTNLWPQISTRLEDNAVRRSLNILLDQLSEKSKKLSQEKKLSSDQLLNIHSTLKEVRSKIETKETLAKNEKRLSVITNKELGPLMKSLAVALSITHDNVNILKETLVELLGKDIEGSFDALLHEVLPELVEAQKRMIPVREPSWQEIFGIEKVKDFFDNVTKMRCSPLNAYRLYTQLSSAMTMFLGFSIKANLIEALILATCPWIGPFLPFSITYAARAISIFGLPVLKKTLPSFVYKTLESLLSIVNEVMSYCLQRIGIVVLKALMHHLLKSDQTDPVMSKIKGIEQNVARHGKIDYAVTPSVLSTSLQISADRPSLKNELNFMFNGTTDSPRLVHIELTPENVQTTVEKWITSIENSHGKHREHINRRANFLTEEFNMHRQIRDLPIPGEVDGDLWENIDDPLKMIKTLNQLLLETHRFGNLELPGEGDVGLYRLKKIHRSSTDLFEYLVTDYTIYAIIDTLARRCPETLLTPDVKPNGIGIALWLSRPTTHLSNSLTSHKLLQLAKYFEIDPCKRYTNEDCFLYEKDRLFQIYHRRKSYLSFVKRFLGSGKNDDIDTKLDINVGEFLSSPEGQYYRRLLKKKSIQQNLSKFGYYETEWNKISMLLLDGHHTLTDDFSLLNKEKIEEESKKTCRILPEAFFYLRSTYFLSRLAMSEEFPNSFSETIPYTHKDSDYWCSNNRTRLSRKNPIPKLMPYCNLHEHFHKLSGHHLQIFRHPGLDKLSIYGYMPSLNPNITYEISNHFDHGHRHSNPFINIQSDIRFLQDTNQRSQYEIMAKPSPNPHHDPLFSIHEKKILRMINTDSADQVIRCLSHFTLHKELLLNATYRGYLYLWSQHIPELEMQIKERPKIIQDFGLFFKDMLDHFHIKKEYAVCLFLADLGSTILKHCERHDLEASKFFPNFHTFIDTKIVEIFRGKNPEDRDLITTTIEVESREISIIKGTRTTSKHKRVINQKQDGLVLSLISLVSSYHELDPQQATYVQKYNVIKAILRLKLCQTTWRWDKENFNIVLKCLETMHLWEPTIKKEVGRFFYFSFNILDSIMLDAGIDTSKREGKWQGEYPYYTKGNISINLSCSGFSDDIKIKEKQRLIFTKTGLTVTGGFAVSPTKIVFNQEDIELYLDQIFLTLGDKKFRSIEKNQVMINKFSAQNECLWIEEREDSPERIIVLQMRGRDVINRYQMQKKDESNDYELIEIEGAPLEEIPMEQSLGLYLLKWFQKPSDIELYVSHAQNPPQLKKIVFTKLNLHFEMRLIKNEIQAVVSDEHSPGFYISKTQLDPHLLSYGQYLLLQNELGERRVHLVAFSWEELSGLFLLKQVGQISTSPYMEKCIHEFMSHPHTHFTYTLNHEGRLESEDPTANFYLMYLHLARGEYKQCFHYLKHVEDLGKQFNFTSEFTDLMQNCMMVLLLTNSPQAEKVYLRLTAIFQENKDKQSNNLIDNPSPTILNWIIKLIKYNNYLGKIENGGEEYLSIFQEKMILNAIDDDLEEIKTTFLKDVHSINKLKSLLGNSLNEYLTMPRIAFRARMLKKQTGEEGSWNTGEVLQHMIFDPTSPKATQIPNFTELGKPLINKITKKTPSISSWSGLKTGVEAEWIPYLFNLYQRFNEYKTDGIWKYPHDALSKDYLNVSTDLSAMTPSMLNKNFLYFYHLAANVLPVGWKDDLELKKKFNLQAKEFRCHFPLLKGKFPNPTSLQAIAILKMVLRKPKKCKHPHKLEKMNPQKFLKTMDLLLEKMNNLSSKVINSLDIDNLSFKKLAKKVTQTTCKNGLFLGKNLFLGSFIRNFNYTKTSVNLGLKMGFGIHHSVKKIQQQNIENKKEVEQRQLSSTVHNRDLLPEDLKQLMQQREHAIDYIMDEFLNTYFVVQEKKLPTKEQPKENTPSTYEEYKDLVDSLKNYDERPQEKLYDYTLKMPPGEGEELVKNQKIKFKELREDLSNLEKDTKQQLKKERSEIKRLIHQSFKNNHKNTLLSSKPVTEKMTFEEIDNLFLQENDHELCRRFKMSGSQLEHLKKRLYLYHVLASRWNLLFASLPKCEEYKQESLALLGCELQRRRVYTLEGSERLIRGKLIFESRTEKMLWEKQSSQMDLVLLSTHWRLIVEMIMASGKTWYGIPMTNYFCANGQQLVINIWPPALATTNIKEISHQARKIFNQTSSSFNITRDLPWKRKFGRVLTHIFERALSQREQLNSTKESLQSMELSFIEEAIAESYDYEDEALESDDEAMLKSLWETLKITRRTGLGCPDEGHKVFDRKNELNYPLGKKKNMQSKHLTIMTKAIFLLGSIPNLSEILSLKGKRPIPLEIKTYQEKILSLLVEKFMDFDLGKNDKNEFKAYISGESESVPEWVPDHPKRSEIAMIRGILTFLFPESLRQTTHVDYNPSKTSGNDYVQPSDCNDNTIETANIESPYETYIKTGLLLLQDKLSKKQLSRLIEYLRNKAEGDARILHIPPERTRAGKFFSEYCKDYSLNFEEKDTNEVYRLLNAHDEVIMFYLESIVAPQITYYEYKLSSNSSNFGSMFSKFISDTGTPYNKGSFPQDTQLINDPGVDGESIRIMEEKCSDPASIQILELPLKEDEKGKKSNIPSPEEALELLIDNYLDKDRSNTAIIDRGAVLNGISSLDVAERLLKYIEEKRLEMKGIAFYHNNEKMMWEKGASAPIPFSQSTILPKERLSYFPQPQTFAADIPQPEGAQAIVTIGADITFNELVQAIWRMRGLLRNGQKLIFVMTPDVRKAISGDRMPTIQDIILFAKRNEQRHVKEDNYEADKQKMHDVVRRAILDKALDASNLNEARKVLRQFKDFFITKVEDDPYLLFGKIRKDTTPQEVFKALRKKYRSMIKKTDLFTIQEKKNLKLKLQQIGHGEYPEKVKVSCENGKIQGDLLHFNKQVQIQAQNEKEVREEINVKEQEKVQVDLIQTAQKQKGHIQTFLPWPKDLQPTALDTWLRVSPLNEFKALYYSAASTLSKIGQSRYDEYTCLASLKSVLNHMNTPHSCAVAEKVSSRILVSPNFVYRGKSFQDLEMYGPYQIPTFEVLVVKKPKEDLPYFILVDQREASYWREKLRQDRKKIIKEEEVKIGLYDVTTGFWVAEENNNFEKIDSDNILFKRIMVQLKFLRGDVEYPKEKEQEILKTWFNTDVENMFTFFKSVYAYHCIKPFEGSHLQSIIESFNKNPKEKWQL